MIGVVLMSICFVAIGSAFYMSVWRTDHVVRQMTEATDSVNASQNLIRDLTALRRQSVLVGVRNEQHRIEQSRALRARILADLDRIKLSVSTPAEAAMASQTTEAVIEYIDESMSLRESGVRGQVAGERSCC